MAFIDEIEELRTELRHSHLTVAERRSAETRLAELRQNRNVEPGNAQKATARH
ncbi:MAG: hypothetical protein RLW68_17185 [Devosia marina]|uniref:hypothetical protein n=1 Tax=Devosia marina TaxID=2683198 RepID=UPI0032EB12C5